MKLTEAQYIWIDTIADIISVVLLIGGLSGLMVYHPPQKNTEYLADYCMLDPLSNYTIVLGTGKYINMPLQYAAGVPYKCADPDGPDATNYGVNFHPYDILILIVPCYYAIMLILFSAEIIKYKINNIRTVYLYVKGLMMFATIVWFITIPIFINNNTVDIRTNMAVVLQTDIYTGMCYVNAYTIDKQTIQ